MNDVTHTVRKLPFSAGSPRAMILSIGTRWKDTHSHMSTAVREWLFLACHDDES